MASRTFLIDQSQQAIAVTIHAEIDQFLRVAGTFAFDPETLTRPRPIGHALGVQRLCNRIGIHPRHHQDFTRFGILRNTGNETLFIIFQAFGIEHGLAPFDLHLSRLDIGKFRKGKPKGHAMSAESDLMKLYSQRILALASDIPHLDRLDHPQASVKKRSPLCGSTVTVDITMDNGKVSGFGQDVKACALGQAAASVVGRNVIGRSLAELETARDELAAMLQGGNPPSAPFDGLEVLKPAADFKNRHASILLCLDATVGAARSAIDA